MSVCLSRQKKRSVTDSRADISASAKVKLRGEGKLHARFFEKFSLVLVLKDRQINLSSVELMRILDILTTCVSQIFGLMTLQKYNLAQQESLVSLPLPLQTINTLPLCVVLTFITYPFLSLQITLQLHLIDCPLCKCVCVCVSYLNIHGNISSN